MIQVDPNDRFFESKEKSPKQFYILAAISIAVVAAGVFYYWNTTTTYERIYSSLGISPLPSSVLIGSGIQEKVDRLAREPCYGDVAADLADALRDKGYPRESATLLISFTKRCPNSDYLLAAAFNALMDIGDIKLAKQISEQLIQSYPAKSLFRYYLARAQDAQGDYSNALTNYIDTIQMDSKPQNLLGDVFYNTSRMFARLGRYCDAITPMETYISFDPSKRRNPQTISIIADFSRKGNCDVSYAQGSARILITDERRVILPVIVNGTLGNFILDTGATLVSVTSEFATKANIKIENRRLTMKTVDGTASADVGYADLIRVGGAQAKGVVLAVIRGSRDPLGGGLDGLLGMSFLARFNVKLSPSGLELTSIELNR